MQPCLSYLTKISEMHTSVKPLTDIRILEGETHTQGHLPDMYWKGNHTNFKAFC